MTENIKEEIEDKVIDLIALGASSRLIVFKPEKSDKDLVVEKRGDYKKKVIFLNIREKESMPENGFAPEENFYFVFVDFDVIRQDIKDDFLVIPSLELSSLAKSGAAGQNDLSRFMMKKKDFVRFLIDKFT